MTLAETSERRYGDWMQVYSGARFYPLDPRAEEVEGSDIAHALSLLCRYGGHATRFYSVAEHCCLMAWCLENDGYSKEEALWALLHDATEAYVGDMVRPLKRFMPEYCAAEDRVMLAVAEKFGLSGAMPAVVKEYDNRILLNERAEVMTVTEDDWSFGSLEPLNVSVTGWGSAEAEALYLNTLNRLTSSV